MSNTSDATQVAPQTAKQQNQRKLISKFAERFAIDESKLMDILKATAFKQRNGQAPTNEQMAALLVVADQYGLNPFTKEIYAFPDQSNGIVPVVGVDGWLRITNNHPQFDGMEFRFSETTVQLKGLDEPINEWIECIIYRKDRTRPTPIREYLSELYRPPVTKSGNNGPYTIKGHGKLTHGVSLVIKSLSKRLVSFLDIQAFMMKMKQIALSRPIKDSVAISLLVSSLIPLCSLRQQLKRQNNQIH